MPSEAAVALDAVEAAEMSARQADYIPHVVAATPVKAPSTIGAKSDVVPAPTQSSSVAQASAHTIGTTDAKPGATQATEEEILQDNKTVRSGIVFKLDQEERRRENAERAARLKEELGTEPITGIEDRLAYRFIKRAFDIVFSAAVLVLFCWLFAIIAIAIKIDDPKGPIIFKQQRVGKNGKTFNMYKFRTMCVDAEEKLASLRELNEKTGPVFKIAEDPRVTRVGKWLRKTSADEFMQFANVLAGQMSIVGPRPALPSEVATYNDYQRQRLLVKPGLTCYWQTRMNRDSISFDEWVDLDLLYIRKCNVWADFKLIIQTIGVVLTAQGS